MKEQKKKKQKKKSKKHRYPDQKHYVKSVLQSL